MLDCSRLRGTSDTCSLFDLCLLRGKNPLWLSNVSHSFPVNLVYRCCRVFICEWKWLWRRRALLCLDNNTYFFHFMLFKESEEKKVKWKVQGCFQKHQFYNSCRRQMQVSNYGPHQMFIQIIGQTVHISWTISTKTHCASFSCAIIK